MKKSLLILSLAAGGLYYITKEKKRKDVLQKIKFSDSELKEQGFVFKCDKGDYIFVISSVNKLRLASKNILFNLLSDPKYSNLGSLDFKNFFSDFMYFFSPSCQQIFTSNDISKSQAIGLYHAMIMTASFLIEEVYGSEKIGAKVTYKPETELSSPEEELGYQEAFEYYSKTINPYIEEFKTTFDITDEDIKNTKNNYIVY